MGLTKRLRRSAVVEDRPDHHGAYEARYPRKEKNAGDRSKKRWGKKKKKKEKKKKQNRESHSEQSQHRGKLFLKGLKNRSNDPPGVTPVDDYDVVAVTPMPDSPAGTYPTDDDSTFLMDGFECLTPVGPSNPTGIFPADDDSIFDASLRAPLRDFAAEDDNASVYEASGREARTSPRNRGHASVEEVFECVAADDHFDQNGPVSSINNPTSTYAFARALGKMGQSWWRPKKGSKENEFAEYRDGTNVKEEKKGAVEFGNDALQEGAVLHEDTDTIFDLLPTTSHEKELDPIFESRLEQKDIVNIVDHSDIASVGFTVILAPCQSSFDEDDFILSDDEISIDETSLGADDASVEVLVDNGHVEEISEDCVSVISIYGIGVDEVSDDDLSDDGYGDDGFSVDGLSDGGFCNKRYKLSPKIFSEHKISENRRHRGRSRKSRAHKVKVCENNVCSNKDREGKVCKDKVGKEKIVYKDDVRKYEVKKNKKVEKLEVKAKVDKVLVARAPKKLKAQTIPAEPEPLWVRGHDRRNLLAWRRCAARSKKEQPMGFPIARKSRKKQKAEREEVKSSWYEPFSSLCGDLFDL
jgi:hypothetical protein